jgi:hypothetical protein
VVEHGDFRVGCIDKLSIEVNLHRPSVTYRENICPACG